MAAVLEKLDAADDSRFRNRRREGARQRFRRTNVPLVAKHPGGSTTSGVAATRDLSNTGVCLVYSSFLHTGTHVSITLPRRLGGEDVLTGAVVYCRHVMASFHQVGVRFEQKIFAKLYADEDALVASTRAVQPAPFAGSVLLIDAQPMDRALVTHHLRGVAARVITTDTVAAAAASLRSTPAESFDVVVCEMNIASLDERIGATVATLRRAGHQGALVVATDTLIGTPARKSLTAAGVVLSIVKPYEREQLMTALSHAVAASGIDRAIATIERGGSEIDAMVKTVAAVLPKPA